MKPVKVKAWAIVQNNRIQRLTNMDSLQIFWTWKEACEAVKGQDAIKEVEIREVKPKRRKKMSDGGRKLRKNPKIDRNVLKEASKLYTKRKRGILNLSAERKSSLKRLISLREESNRHRRDMRGRLARL